MNVMTQVCSDLKCDGSVDDVIDMTRSMIRVLGVRIIQDDDQLSAVDWNDLWSTCEVKFWSELFKGVDTSRLQMTMESHLHALSDEDIPESDLSSLSPDLIDLLKRNRHDEDVEREVAEVRVVERDFHFQRTTHNERIFLENA